MAISYEEILETKKSLEPEYQNRHDAFKKLRAYYHGDFWNQADQSTRSLTTIFRDLVGDKSDFGPDIKVVNNLLFVIVTKYQSFLSTAPMIRAYVDPPGNQRQRAQSTLKERYLYGTWAEGKMTTQLGQLGWYLPLMGHAFIGAFPDLARNRVVPVLRSPEHAYPLSGYDGSELDGVMFAWECRESAARRAFPVYQPKRRGLLRRSREADRKVWVYEYSDSREWCRFVDGERVNGVEHELGFNLFDQAKFIDVPGEPWGHGAVEQVVNQVELGNALESLLFQAVIDNVFPTLVLTDPSKAPEEIERGPGSVIPLHQGGRAEYLNAPVNLPAGLGMIEHNERMVKQNTSMPDVSLGSFRASIVTGKAINELQGAGTGSTVEMVQSNIGPALVGFNERAIYMAQTMFRDETIYLQGFHPATAADINPKQFAFKAKGSQLIGSARNEVVFQPHMDLQTKVVVGLQMAGAGLVSKQWQREQAGIPDSAAMDEEILAEAVQDAVFGFVLGSLDPANPDVSGAVGFIETGSPAQQAPAPGGVAPPVPPGTLEQLGAPAPGNGAPVASAGEAPTAPPPAAASAEEPGISVEQAATAIQALGQVPGRVFLVGEIVEAGSTEDEVEIAVTDKAAIGPIRSGVEFPTDFTLVEGQPAERFLEVTPGQETAEGGADLTLEQLIA